MRLLLLTLTLTKPAAPTVVEILSRAQPPGEPLASFPIATDDGAQHGLLEFYKGDATVDSVAAFCSKHDLPAWFRKAIAAKICEGSIDVDASVKAVIPPCWRTRALFYEEAIQAPDADRNYPGKLEVWEDEDPTKAVELFLLKAEKEILKNRTTWDAQHERWEKNRTKNVALAQETQDIARRRGERDKALIQINELDWLLDNHTLSEPMRVPTGWFRKVLVDHVCSLPGLKCLGRRQPLPELPITVDGSDKPKGILRMFEGDEAVDAAYFFGKQHGLSSKEFRESMMNYLCQQPGVSCTRKKARVFSRSPADILGVPDMAYWPDFEVWEGEEATDNAFDYARRYDLDLEQRYALLHAACNDGFVECERGDPIAFFFPVHEDETEKGRVEMSPYQLPGDAVYDYCKKEKYLQPKYTKMHVRANLHETFCQALELDRGLTETQRISCESGPRTAREPRFVQEFTVSELKYKMPFYDDEFPPCDGRPGPDGLDPEAPFNAQNWTQGCVPRELRAGEALCGRMHPYPPGCGPHMAEFIAESLARAERRRFQMTSPFGYDYYLSLATLRDADNDTLVDAYLRGVAPLPGMLAETLQNLTALNETLKASRETHLHARRALAHARGARRVATEALYDAEARLKALRDAVSSAFVEAGTFVTQKRLSPAVWKSTSELGYPENYCGRPLCTFTPSSRRGDGDDVASMAWRIHAIEQIQSPADAIKKAAILFPPLPPTLLGSRKALQEAVDDTNRADELLHAGDLLLDDAQARHADARPQADHLEEMSRVFREGYETLTDKKRRETHDKPCKKIFGACCAKDTDGGGKDIKCGGDFENAE